MKLAIVCSWLNQYGGAERVLEVVHAMYPQAPVFTSIFWPDALPAAYRDWDIRPSFLNRLPLIHRHHQWFLLGYPLAFERMDLSDYDTVLSVTSAFAHAVVTGPQTRHICYCLTPARFIWDFRTYVAREGMGRRLQSILPFVLPYLRAWDRAAADRVDQFVAISEAVRQRIDKVYRRDARVIYPPVDVGRFRPSTERGDHFLIISRLVPYKRIDLAIEACNQLRLPLWIIGDGRDRPALQAMAGPTVRFLGRLSDEETARHLAQCRAFIFPGEEDFGIAPLEAQAAGRPVIAYAGGGALETIVDGQTGLFFHAPAAQSLADAISRFRDADFDPVATRQNALRFDRAAFEEQLRLLVQENRDPPPPRQIGE